MKVRQLIGFVAPNRSGSAMTFSELTLVSLIDDADYAYQDTRWRVWDQLAPGEPVDVTQLSASQQSSLSNLHAAETAVAQYRALAYSSVEAGQNLAH
jgi:hypothetical protein